MLIALDLPELDRPAKATSEPKSVGAFSMALALCKNAALRKLSVSVACLKVGHFAICATTRNVYNATLSGRLCLKSSLFFAACSVDDAVSVANQ
ncbi:MAG: hypothetical protein CM15mP74_13990 [Halieaceae bacterium]|nr:MAG: hypothetical protein CM15mP74_13990 [Halieaceae bacterium]